jgi:hypothetical protein
MAVFRRWKNEGVISDEDLTRVAIMLADKYGLPFDSIYLDQDLLCPEN